jgi:hypothetical protein
MALIKCRAFNLNPPKSKDPTINKIPIQSIKLSSIPNYSHQNPATPSIQYNLQFHIICTNLNFGTLRRCNNSSFPIPGIIDKPETPTKPILSIIPLPKNYQIINLFLTKVKRKTISRYLSVNKWRMEKIMHKTSGNPHPQIINQNLKLSSNNIKSL